MGQQAADRLVMPVEECREVRNGLLALQGRPDAAGAWAEARCAPAAEPAS